MWITKTSTRWIDEKNYHHWIRNKIIQEWTTNCTVITKLCMESWNQYWQWNVFQCFSSWLAAALSRIQVTVPLVGRTMAAGSGSDGSPSRTRCKKNHDWWWRLVETTDKIMIALYWMVIPTFYHANIAISTDFVYRLMSQYLYVSRTVEG